MTDLLIAFGVAAAIWLVAFGGDGKEVKALRREVRELRRIVDGLAAQQGYVVPPSSIQVPGVPAYEPSPEVHAFVAEGRKIAAVKQVREETGLGLAEAKAIVDALEKR